MIISQKSFICKRDNLSATALRCLLICLAYHTTKIKTPKWAFDFCGGDEGLPRSALPTLRCNRDDYTALCLCNLLVVEPGNCVAMSSYLPCISHNKNKTPKRAFDFCGGDEGIRTLDTVARIPHFQCGALDQLCDISN